MKRIGIDGFSSIQRERGIINAGERICRDDWHPSNEQAIPVRKMFGRSAGHGGLQAAPWVTHLAKVTHLTTTVGAGAGVLLSVAKRLFNGLRP